MGLSLSSVKGSPDFRRHSVVRSLDDALANGGINAKAPAPHRGIMLICGALLMPYPSEAAAPGLAPNLHGALSVAGPVEQARCWRRRVCGPRGCF